MVRELCVRHNVLCVSDEVYEWLVYPPTKHIKIGNTHICTVEPQSYRSGGTGQPDCLCKYKIGINRQNCHAWSKSIHGPNLFTVQVF